MKKTVFSGIHAELKARMVPFAGYLMPVEYSGITNEHLAVRNSAGIFDVSHMGQFWVKGTNAAPFLQYITSNDISRLGDGMVQYTCFPNGKGGIVDDLLIYRIDSVTYMLVVNSANIEKDWNWCLSHASGFNLVPGKDIYNASDEISLLAIQGPKALEIVQELTSTNLFEMDYYTFKKVDIAGLKNAILSITGYTGSGGCEIYVSNEDGPQLYRAIMEAGIKHGLKPAGLAARDTLRLEMGYCLYGNDIDDESSPIEAGLGWITRFSENNIFIDRELLEKQKNEGTARKLVGFVLSERGIPRQNYEISDDKGNLIGKVTSGTMSISLGKGIGMGYVDSNYAIVGSRFNIVIRNKLVPAEVVKMPFYKK